MAMLEIRNVQKTFRTDAKTGLHAGIFHRPGMQDMILGHIGTTAAHPCSRNFLLIQPYGHFSLLRLIKSQGKLQEGRFAAAGGSDQALGPKIPTIRFPPISLVKCSITFPSSPYPKETS